MLVIIHNWSKCSKKEMHFFVYFSDHYFDANSVDNNSFLCDDVTVINVRKIVICIEAVSNLEEDIFGCVMCQSIII